MSDFSRLKIAHQLPSIFGRPDESAADLLRCLRGARIVDVGTPDDAAISIEGGGLVIDFVPVGSEDLRRAVFGFTETGMWLEWEGAIAAADPSQ